MIMWNPACLLTCSINYDINCYHSSASNLFIPQMYFMHITSLHHSIIIFMSLFSLFNKLLERMKKIKEFFIDCNNDIVITGEFVYI